MTKNESPKPRSGAATGWMVLIGSAVGVFALGLLATTIMERRTEEALGRLTVTNPVDQFESDNAKWGDNFPRQYDSWKATEQMVASTKYGGSKESDHLASNPNLVMLFAGYPFAKDYNSPRGHRYAVEDVKNTGRRSDKTPATCWTCKSPDVPRVMNRDGVDEYYAHKFDHYLEDINHSIGCADCHDSKTMKLQISRPALKEALVAQGKDLAKITHQEMRSLVCAQCHVEYYFKGKKEQKLTFPWDYGTTAEAMEKYYEESGHTDWTHAISGAKMVKMQHPDYEMYMEGIHAARGVSCADCHMPYKTEGGVKFTDHQIQSPLLNVANSCQVCHRWDEKQVKDRIFGMQDKHKEVMHRAEKSLIALHFEIGDAASKGATDAQLEQVRKQVSLAQMYWDYVSANNGMGFHAPQESARVLAKANDIAMEARLAVQQIRMGMGLTAAVVLPDFSTKEKAQSTIKPYVDAAAAKAKAAEAKKTAEAQPAAQPKEVARR
ncbi:MAG: ammonia-forming cytochrome c nitrite reductase subunit c552 [Fimbriimonadaceae bacterium]|nr:ammonia-forming cytochrome c nitrite reductase subunit c552 [Fimbriimonadaceae bacterium]